MQIQHKNQCSVVLRKKGNGQRSGTFWYRNVPESPRSIILLIQFLHSYFHSQERQGWWGADSARNLQDGNQKWRSVGKNSRKYFKWAMNIKKKRSCKTLNAPIWLQSGHSGCKKFTEMERVWGWADVPMTSGISCVVFFLCELIRIPRFLLKKKKKGPSVLWAIFISTNTEFRPYECKLRCCPSREEVDKWQTRKDPSLFHLSGKSCVFSISGWSTFRYS